MEIVIVVVVLVAVAFAVAFTLVWQRQGRTEDRQTAIEARLSALELAVGHGHAHEEKVARGGAAVSLKEDRTVLGRLTAVEIFVLVNRRRRPR